MHTLIAFLAFIFSPSDNWLLKRAYELALDPNPWVTVASYEQIQKHYAARLQNKRRVFLLVEKVLRIIEKEKMKGKVERIRQGVGIFAWS